MSSIICFQRMNMNCGNLDLRVFLLRVISTFNFCWIACHSLEDFRLRLDIDRFLLSHSYLHIPVFQKILDALSAFFLPFGPWHAYEEDARLRFFSFPYFQARYMKTGKFCCISSMLSSVTGGEKAFSPMEPSSH